MNYDSVANIRQHLAAKVPIQDQILLLGPPYKVPRDSTLRSEEVLASLRLGDKEDTALCSLTNTERSGARRLFLFSKQHLSGSAPDLPPCILQPTNLTLPTRPDACPIIFQKSISSPTSPLHQALEVYERQFMLNLCHGRALADGADLRIAACRSCISEQSVIAQALRAAVSNLSFYRNNAIRIRSEITSDFQTKTSKHYLLLDQFNKKMEKLADERLHPALINVARSSGRMIETLLDTIPVEREKVWAAQCRTAHDRLQDLFREIDIAFAQSQKDTEREVEAKLDRTAEADLISLSKEVEENAMQIRDKQSERLDHLTKDHGNVISVVMGALSCDADQGQVVQPAFSTLEEMSKKASNILPEMNADDTVLKDLMKRIGDSKTEAMKRMKQRLHKISIAQSNIGSVLKKVDILRAALVQQSEDMSHLEHVVELKSSYRDFLNEIRRRKAYGNAVTSSSTAILERLTAMRSDEVKARERFLRGSGRHLMPAFFEIFVPTLASPPPILNPQLPPMVEMDTLPDVGISDEDAQLDRLNAEISTASDAEAGNSSMEQSEKASINEDSSTPASAQSGNLINENQTQQSVMISTDEHSSNEIMESYRENRCIAEAERETLVYENAVLRQILERTGTKITRTYIEEAKIKEKDILNTISRENQLKKLKAKVASLEKALLDKDKEERKQPRSTKLSDKISHSSFNVSEVSSIVF